MVDPASDLPVWKQVRKRGWTRPLAADVNGDGADDVIYGDQDTAPHVLEAFDGRTGKTLWTAAFPRPPRAGATLAVSGCRWDGKIRLLDPATGIEAASSTFGAPVPWSRRGPTIFATTGRVARAGGRRRPGSSGPARPASRCSHVLRRSASRPPPASESAVIYLDAATGRELWRRSLAGPGQPAGLRDRRQPPNLVRATPLCDRPARLRRLDAWAWTPHHSWSHPLWCDLDADGRPELLVVSATGIHALNVALTARRTFHWGRADLRSAAQAAGYREIRPTAGPRSLARAAGPGPRRRPRGRSAEAAWIAAMAASNSATATPVFTRWKPVRAAAGSSTSKSPAPRRCARKRPAPSPPRSRARSPSPRRPSVRRVAGRRPARPRRRRIRRRLARAVALAALGELEATSACSRARRAAAPGYFPDARRPPRLGRLATPCRISAPPRSTEAPPWTRTTSCATWAGAPTTARRRTRGDGRAAATLGERAVLVFPTTPNSATPRLAPRHRPGATPRRPRRETPGRAGPPPKGDGGARAGVLDTSRPRGDGGGAGEGGGDAEEARRRRRRWRGRVAEAVRELESRINRVANSSVSRIPNQPYHRRQPQRADDTIQRNPVLGTNRG